jgi:hypothetical protein
MFKRNVRHLPLWTGVSHGGNRSSSMQRKQLVKGRLLDVQLASGAKSFGSLAYAAIPVIQLRTYP